MVLPSGVGATDGSVQLQHPQREPPITSSYAFHGEGLRDLALRYVGKPISELAPDLKRDLAVKHTIQSGNPRMLAAGEIEPR